MMLILKPAAIVALALVSTVVMAPVAAQTREEILCGPLANAYGPFDYRIYKDRFEIKQVDQHHFTPLVENLIKPMFQHFAADFDYTLRASPNHHRALISMARYSERVKDPKPPGANYTADCYFDRAMRFAKDDMIVRMIYAGHLGRTGRKPEALVQLNHVAASAADNAFTHYNVGLGYFEVGEYDKAAEHARVAAELGLGRTELREKLKALGRWTEPATAAADAAPAQAPAQSAAASSAARPAP